MIDELRDENLTDDETTEEVPPTQEQTKNFADGDVSPKEIEDGKIFAVLSYFFLWFIPYLMEDQKGNRFTMFHANLGMVLFGLQLILFIISMALSWTCIIPLLVMIPQIALIVLAIIGIVKSLNGEMWKMPLVYDIVVKLNL
ncbi:MAG: hypothetical protein B6244_05705 [Candidatus Cloacimonetes bacterium 4572_55]|nr:MAG: hypothetical protein B6244_05705 [Candidatus Cloacimonetes bacterium 4572_55]